MLDMPDWLYEYLQKLDTDTLIEVMADALDAMQAWNGRTVTYCIVSSIPGAECEEQDTGGYTYTLPKIEPVIGKRTIG